MMEGIFICAAPHCLRSFLKKPDFEAHVHELHSNLLQADAEKEENNESDVQSTKQQSSATESTLRGPLNPNNNNNNPYTDSGLLSLGMRVHSMLKGSNLRFNAFVLNALLDMYAKCGSLGKAFDVFHSMEKKDFVSWNTMLHGLGVHGHGKEALELFSRMVKEGIRPDKVTFVAVLCACNHTGLVDEGIDYFYSMERVYAWSRDILSDDFRKVS